MSTETPKTVVPKTVAKKMGVKRGTRAHLVGGPADVVAAMQLPDLELSDVESPDELSGEFDYLHLFVTSEDEMRVEFPELKKHLRRGGMLWVSWPKSGRLSSDLNMKTVIKIGYDYGLVESICLRVDDVWAGLKFTYPKPGKIYNNSYGTLPHAVDSAANASPQVQAHDHAREPAGD